MPISFDDIETAFLFVNIAPKYENKAYLDKKTGQTYFVSDMGDSDELPEDIDNTDKYISIPHKTNLDLGKKLVLEFVLKHLPDEEDRIHHFFRSKGAYSRYKDFLMEKNLLDEWHEFSDKREKEALKKWCRQNKIDIGE